MLLIYKKFITVGFILGSTIILSACAAENAGEYSGTDASASSEPVAESGSSDKASEPGNSGIQAGILTAGDIDDNLNFELFQNYLDSNSQDQQIQTSLHGRITIKVSDADQNPAGNIALSLSLEGSDAPFLTSYTGANGEFQFFPQLFGVSSTDNFLLTISSPAPGLPPVSEIFSAIDLESDQTLNVNLAGFTNEPVDELDLMLVIDTTGSMGDELEYIKVELNSIVQSVKQENPQVSINFGLTVYRDEGDAYVVRHFDFVDSLSQMQSQLDEQYAGGGGDYPEAMDKGLAQALASQWRTGNTSRLVFLIADAPPHSDNIQRTLDLVDVAVTKGVHVHSLSASGVDEGTEALLRLLAMYTQGRYLFLTDDSGIGNEHLDPSVPCYQVTRLNQLIVRVISSELSGERVEAEDADVIRTVGNFDNGVCLLDQQ